MYDESHLFYQLALVQPGPPPPSLPDGYLLDFWQPGRVCFSKPDGLPQYFWIWSVLHTFGLFANSHYGVCRIFHKDRLVHHTTLFPGFFRFPFMRQEDLQIGDVWTSPEHRRLGLARLAVGHVLARLAGRPGRVWYITRTDNMGSRRLIERFPIRQVLTGQREPGPLGLRILGHYVLTAED